MKIWRIFIVSTIAGFFLGFFMKWIEYLFGYKVYTLLMNIDYIPILKEYTFPEWIEFTFHLIIAIAVGYVVVYIVRRRTLDAVATIKFAVGLNIIIAIFYYPTTTFSDRTPELLSFPSFSWWVIGHVLYGFMLSILLIRSKAV